MYFTTPAELAVPLIEIGPRLKTPLPPLSISVESAACAVPKPSESNPVTRVVTTIKRDFVVFIFFSLLVGELLECY
jgi:hypothetical protein